ncbi:MAG: VacJ family lipoprotein [Desulfobacteraceae bacterium]|nr:VacJ family lipoprotein [Desulfobacteraceae bacterium]
MRERAGTRAKCGFLWVITVLVLLGLAPVGAATVFAASDDVVVAEYDETPVAVNDPYENFNRAMFKLNDRIYFWVLKPTGIVYAAYFPPGLRGAVRNAFSNFVFPARFVNSTLQGRMDNAGTELARFLLNSTLGLAGLVDVAQIHFNLAPSDRDFGQTLAHWGAGSGPYLMIPVLGPSNPRDLIGYAADSAMDPMFWIPAEWWVSPTVKAGKIVNNASLRIGEYEDLKKSALDPYVAIRDGYTQYRNNQIKK